MAISRMSIRVEFTKDETSLRGNLDALDASENAIVGASGVHMRNEGT